MTLVTHPITGTHNDSTFYEVVTDFGLGRDTKYERLGGKYWNPKTGQWEVTQNFEELKEKWNDPDATLMKTDYKLGPIRNGGYDYLKTLSREDAQKYDLSPDYWLPLDDPNQTKKIIIKSPVDKREQGGVLFSKDGSKVKKYKDPAGNLPTAKYPLLNEAAEWSGTGSSFDGVYKYATPTDTFYLQQLTTRVPFRGETQHIMKGGKHKNPKTGKWETSQNYDAVKDIYENNGKLFNRYPLSEEKNGFWVGGPNIEEENWESIREYDKDPKFWSWPEGKKITIKDPDGNIIQF